MGEGTEPRPAPHWYPNLGPLGYCWDQIPVAYRALWRPHVIGTESPHVLPAEYVVGLDGFGVVLAVPGGDPPSHDRIRTLINRRGLPVCRPLAGCGFIANTKIAAPLCHLLKWAECCMDRRWGFSWRPATREEVE